MLWPTLGEYNRGKKNQPGLSRKRRTFSIKHPKWHRVIPTRVTENLVVFY
jgi:hypothetical protein